MGGATVFEVAVLVTKFTDDCTVCSMENLRLVLRSLAWSTSAFPGDVSTSSADVELFESKSFKAAAGFG